MDDVKVTIIGVERELRQDLKVACLKASTSVSAELRGRLPRIIEQLQGHIMDYDDLVELTTGLLGIVNLALAERLPEARQAFRELNGDIHWFQRQLHHTMTQRGSNG